MDVRTLLADLRYEQDRIGRAIKALERWDGSGPIPVPETRGRKSMAPAERLEVSERMKRYWAKRKAQSAADA